MKGFRYVQQENFDFIPEDINMKWCRLGKHWIGREHFHKSKTTKDKLMPECKSCALKRKKETYTPRDPEYQRRMALMRMYKISSDDYQKMYATQEGLCASCHRPETSTDHRTGKLILLAVDHCHKTGRIRALLCRDCNIALGHLADDPERIQALLNYIKEQTHD